MCMELGISRYGSHSGGGSAGANFHEPCKSPPVVTISLLCPLRHGGRPSSQKGYVTPTVHVQTLALEMPPKTHASLGVCTLLVVEKNQLGISPEGVCYPACYTVAGWLLGGTQRATMPKGEPGIGSYFSGSFWA